MLKQESSFSNKLLFTGLSRLFVSAELLEVAKNAVIEEVPLLLFTFCTFKINVCNAYAIKNMLVHPELKKRCFFVLRDCIYSFFRSLQCHKNWFGQVSLRATMEPNRVWNGFHKNMESIP